MKKLLIVVFLFTWSGLTYALEPRSGVLIDVAGGYTPSILAINSGISRAGYLGYKFNSYFSVEGGYTSLLNQSSSGPTTATSISGPEFAGIVKFVINDRVSPFIRVGFTKMSIKSNSTSGASSIENIYGPSYGAGLQFYEIDHLALRVGYNVYNLQTNSDYNVAAGIPVNASNAYVALIIQF